MPSAKSCTRRNRHDDPRYVPVAAGVPRDDRAGSCRVCYRRSGTQDRATIPMTSEEKIQQRFFAKVQKTATCWLWTACSDRRGYGSFSIACRTVRAHRASYLIHYGQIPNKMFVCHTCDTPKCVNPSHLFLGLHQDNMDDMVRKGRSPKTRLYGNRNAKVKLSADDVQTIRKMAANGTPQKVIAAHYKISQPHVSDICRMKTRKTDA